MNSIPQSAPQEPVEENRKYTRTDAAADLATIIDDAREHGPEVARGFNALCHLAEERGFGLATDAGIEAFPGSELEIVPFWAEVMKAHRQAGGGDATNDVEAGS